MRNKILSMKHNILLGAIAGDVIWSTYEYSPVCKKDFDLFGDHSRYSVDSIFTVAIAEWLLNGGSLKSIMQKHGSRYIGETYCNWLTCMEPKAYGSLVGHPAMRVSPIGWAFDSLAETLEVAEQSTVVTHNHPEDIKGTQATAVSIFMARTGWSKKEIKIAIEEIFGYDLSKTCDELRPSNTDEKTFKRAVPDSIIAFLESTDFEDAIRLSVLHSGHTDTAGAIAGAIAEAYYKEIPEHIVTGVLKRLPDEFKEVMEKFYEKFYR